MAWLVNLFSKLANNQFKNGLCNALLVTTSSTFWTSSMEIRLLSFLLLTREIYTGLLTRMRCARHDRLPLQHEAESIHRANSALGRYVLTLCVSGLTTLLVRFLKYAFTVRRNLSVIMAISAVSVAGLTSKLAGPDAVALLVAKAGIRAVNGVAIMRGLFLDGVDAVTIQLDGSSAARLVQRAIRAVQGMTPFEELPAFGYRSAGLNDTGQIRILKLHRRIPFVELEAELIPVHIDAQEYDCISYVWGSPGEATCPLRLNGAQFHVTPSVHTILLTRSSIWTPVYIWIDSLCINQRGTEEKTSQVRMMGQIYANAQRVFICLGDARDAQLALSLFTEFNEGPVFAADNQVDLEAYMAAIQLGSRLEMARWKAFWELLNHPWFRRVWVIQEIARARCAIVVYGGIWRTWEYIANPILRIGQMEFSGFGEHILNSRQNLEAVRRGTAMSFLNAIKMDFWRDHLYFTGPIPLLSALKDTSPFEASQPIDKLFAVLPLTDAILELEHLIDYNNTTGDVLLGIASYLCEQSSIIETLEFAGIGYENAARERADDTVPSWVVDWTVTRPQRTVVGQPQHSPPTQYRTAVERPPVTRVSVDGRVLQAAGLRIDVIKALTSTPQLVEEEDGPPLITHWLIELQEFARSHLGDTYPKTTRVTLLEEALSRFFIGDKTLLERPAPPRYYNLVERALAMDEIRRRVVTNPEASHAFSKEYITQLLEDRKDMMEAPHLFAIHSHGRRACVTDTGYLAAVPEKSQCGDIIVVLYGAETPFVLRGVGAEGSTGRNYQLVGDCYVHGIMDGEALALPFHEEIFSII